jgi:hypothetical protein
MGGRRTVEASRLMTRHFVNNPARQCHNKIKWTTKKAAKVNARRSETSLGGGRLETYPCPHCGFWHNGHRPKGPA